MLTREWYGVVAVQLASRVNSCPESCAANSSDSCIQLIADHVRLSHFTADAPSSLQIFVLSIRQLRAGPSPLRTFVQEALPPAGGFAVRVQLTLFRFAFDFHGFI